MNDTHGILLSSEDQIQMISVNSIIAEVKQGEKEVC